METGQEPPRSSHDPDAMFAQIRALVSQVRNQHVRALLLAFLDDPEIAPAFRVAPAAKAIHHAFLGGLCEHTLSVLQLGWRICDHYPQLDRDLVTAGALLHDIGKSREISTAPGFEYTDEGKLVGHLVLTCQLIREKAARIPGFPPDLEWQITHLVVAHHGRQEYGSPKEPVTLEAMVVHALDELDTRVSSFGQLLAQAQGRWTESKNLYRRQLFKGGAAAPADDPRRFEGPGVYREGK
jgi:3'-5' exoribonuclease